MSDTTAANLLIGSPTPRLYQRLLKGAVTYGELGNRIIREIKAAHAFRRVEAVRQLASVLLNNPVREFRLIAEYYLVWCDCRERKYDAAALDCLIDRTTTYKTKALISRAGFEGHRGDIDRELYFYLEALKSASDISDYVNISRAIAVVKSKEGFHQSAMRDLESLGPVSKYAEPLVYFDYLNSLAVELGETGRKAEARDVIRRVLASPYAPAYPEWQQTASDLKPSSRSVAVPGPAPTRAGMLLSMPPVERAGPVRQDRPATVISLEQWKKRMVKEDNAKASQGRPRTTSERVMYIMNHITAELTNGELDLIIEKIDEVHIKKDKK
jgi:hypothetical protein